MRIRQTIVLLLGALLTSVPLAAEEAEEPKNLIDNPGFEEMDCSSMLGCSVKDWNTQLGSATAEKTDKYEGGQSVLIAIPSSGMNGYLNQQVSIPDDQYAKDSQFELILHYKVVKMAAAGELKLDCFWEAAAGGDSEAAAAHDADKLKAVIANAVTTEWNEVKVVTTKPAKTARLTVGLRFTKGSNILFDDFSLKHKESEKPYITVMPDKLSPVSVNLGEEKAFQTLKVRQGHVTSETTFAITGADPDQFTLSATSMPVDQTEMDLIVTYKPDEAGNHKAALIFDNVDHTTILPNYITLQGTCSDPTKKPEITVTPTSITDFQAVAGEEQVKSIHVESANCTDYVYLKMEHIEGAAFISGSSMLAKNFATDVSITFHPLVEGEYESKLTIYTQDGEPVVVTLKGKAENRSTENIDWSTDFHWDLSAPLTSLNEKFDSVGHNKTIVLEGWQNVAPLDARPWWGFDEARTSPARGDNRCAKATAYQFGKENTGTWETWLVTPALDYKNTETKTFVFSIMGEYLPEDGSETKLEIYYIDANIGGGKDTVYFQNLTESFDIPKVSDENLTWRTFILDLSPYAETVADIFHMAFHFVGPNGADGAVVYYIDNVSWGVVKIDPDPDPDPEPEPQPEEGIDEVRSETSDVVRSEKHIRDGQVIIVRGEKEYSILGVRLF